MKKIELLSPAGSFDALKAAVNYGADAVYLGGANFSARAFARNFDHDELVEAVKYCHLRGVKVYVTINTLLTEKELKNALEEARFCYRNNVDALIIQDLGLYYLIKKEMPDLDLHASTQMHIHNVEGIKNARKLGFKKAVIARESSLDLIKQACKEDIDIECFIHGAICVSYSGQCLMSSVSKDRSANKGMCAQCCRLRYELYDLDDRKSVKTDTDYLLSPKDMFLLEDIPDLIDAGVASLKIEGRMKSPAYVGLVTKLYREAIDAHYAGRHFQITEQDMKELLSVFNRGFTSSYLHDSEEDIFGNKRPNHMGTEIGKVISAKGKRCFIELSDDLYQFDGIRVIGKDRDVGCILNKLTVNGKYVSKADKGETIEVTFDESVKEGSTVVRTLDHQLEERLNEMPTKRRPFNMQLTMKAGIPVRVVCDLGDLHFEKEYDLIPDKARTAPLDKNDLFAVFSKANDSPFVLNELKCELDDVFIVKSRLNELRRDLYRSFEEAVLNSFRRGPSIVPELGEIKINDDHRDLIESHVSAYPESQYISLVKDPIINTEGKYRYPETVSEFGGLFNAAYQKTAYYTLNVSNSYAYELLSRLGFERIILSTELKEGQIYDLVAAFKERTGLSIKPYVLVYGRRPLMYIRRDPFARYTVPSHRYLLRDGLNEYQIRYAEECTELVEIKPYINKKSIPELTDRFMIIDEISDLKELKNVL